MLELMDDAHVLLRRDVIAVGYDDKAIQRLLRRGVLVRIRQGAYTLREQWASWGPVERHRCLSHAVLRQYHDSDVALSHASAVQHYGGPNWGLDLSTVHLTSLHGTGGRIGAGITHHRGALRAHDATRSPAGSWITAPTRTVLDTASIVGLDAGVVTADWFLHAGLTTKAELRQQSQQMDQWPHTLRLRRVIDLADGRMESVGESLCMQLFRKENLPLPVPQWEIWLPSGALAGRTDFAWPEHQALGEFDGKEKYLSRRRAGETVAEAVMREKTREDLLRELTGWTMIRFTWADLHQPQRTAERVRRHLRRPAA